MTHERCPICDCVVHRGSHYGATRTCKMIQELREQNAVLLQQVKDATKGLKSVAADADVYRRALGRIAKQGLGDESWGALLAVAEGCISEAQDALGLGSTEVVCDECCRTVRLIDGRMQAHPNWLADDDCESVTWTPVRVEP